MFKNNVFQWVKLPTTEFRTGKTKNLRNPRDRAPLKERRKTMIQWYLVSIRMSTMLQEYVSCLLF